MCLSRACAFFMTEHIMCSSYLLYFFYPMSTPLLHGCASSRLLLYCFPCPFRFLLRSSSYCLPSPLLLLPFWSACALQSFFPLSFFLICLPSYLYRMLIHAIVDCPGSPRNPGLHAGYCKIPSYLSCLAFSQTMARRPGSSWSIFD